MAIKMIHREWCPYSEDFRKEFIADAEADVADLPECCTGSTALISDGGKVYIVNASGEWVEFGVEV